MVGLPVLRRVRPMLVALPVCALLLAGCDGEKPTPVPTPTGASVLPTAPPATPAPVPTPTSTAEATASPQPQAADSLRANLYAAAIRALLQNEEAGVVYISPYIGMGDRLDEPDPAARMPSSVIEAVGRALPGVKAEMLDFEEAIGPLDDGGKVDDGGVFVTLGSIEQESSGSGVYIVRASIYREIGSAEGNRFRLAPDPDAPSGWRVLDTTQLWSDRG